jgi:hypothetical protein
MSCTPMREELLVTKAADASSASRDRRGGETRARVGGEVVRRR